MARGISENDVHTAADELVAAGERPTVDRIRGHLGTGSPNTVTRWLDTWWRSLGTRLANQERSMALAQAPEAVGRLAQQLWEQALAAAEGTASEAFATQANELEAQRVQLARQMRQWEDVLKERDQAVQRAQAALASAEADLTHARALIERQDAQILDLASQRDAAEQGRGRLLEQLAEATARQQATDAAALAEREALRRHLQAMEDRAHAEVDRARQETKQIRLDLGARVNQLESELRDQRKREEAARKNVGQQALEIAQLSARVEALSQQKSAPPKPQAARQRAAAAAKPTERPTKRVGRKA